MSEPTPPANGLQQALARAAADPSFRAELVARRSRAASAAGIALSESERSILDTIPEEQLAAMVASLPPVSRPTPELELEAVRGIRADEVYPVMGSRPGMVRGHTSRVAIIAAGAAVVGGAICVGTVTHGIRPDVPRPRVEAANDLSPAPDAGPPPKPDAADRDAAEARAQQPAKTKR